MAPSASATASMSSSVPIEIRRHWDSSAAPDTSRTRMPCSSKSRWKTVRAACRSNRSRKKLAALGNAFSPRSARSRVVSRSRY